MAVIGWDFVRRFCLIFIWAVMLTAGLARAEDKHFSVRGAESTNYDDNVTFSHNKVIRDVVQTLQAGMDIKNETSRNSLLMQADIGQNFYAHNNAFNNTAVTFSVTDLFEISQRLKLNMMDHYDRADEPRSFEDAFGRTTGRYRTDRNRFSAALDFDLNSQTKLSGTYRNEFTGYSRKDLDNSFLNQTGGHIDFHFNDANRIGGEYQYALRRFESGTDIAAHAVKAEYGHHLTSQLELVLKAGGDFLYDTSTGHSSGGDYEASLVNDIDRKTQALLSYRRGLNSYAYSKDLFDSWQISAAFSRDIARRISAQGTAFYGRGSYRQSRIKDNLAGAAFGIRYSLTEQCRVGIQYNFSETESSQSSGSYHRNFAGLQTEMKF